MSPLDHKFYGFTDADLKREFHIQAPELGSVLGAKTTWVLGDLMKVLNKSYCGNFGVETAHMFEREEKTWIKEQIEGLQLKDMSNKD